MNNNDFTLQELKLIQDNLSWNECAEVNQKLLILNNKLKEMIEHYCEHDFLKTYRERDVLICDKCDKEIINET